MIAMLRPMRRLAAGLGLVLALSSAVQAATYYWDINGTGVSGAGGGTTPTGTWDGANAFWNPDPAGGAANGPAIASPTSGDVINFSAGATATGSYTVTISSGTRSVAGVVMQDGATTISGGTSLTIGASGIQADATVTNNLIYNTPVILGASQTWTLNNGLSNGMTMLGGVSDGGAGYSITKTGSGRVNFNSAIFNYTGGTTINAGGIRLNGTNTITTSNAASNVITINTTNSSVDGLLFGGAGSGVFQYTVSTIAGTGNLALRDVNSLAAITLTLGSSTSSNYADTTFSGVISGGGSIIKNHVNTLTLSNTASTYSGLTRINAGVLEVSKLANGGQNSSIGASSNAPENLVFNGGTLRYTGAGDTTDRRFDLGTAGAVIDSSGAGALVFSNTGQIGLTLTGPRTLTFAGTNTATNRIDSIIREQSALNFTQVVKSGGGTWSFTAANTYTGGTTISGGLLLANNTTGSATGTGLVTVQSGGRFGGTGAVTSNVQVNSGGRLAPGASTESLAVGALTMNSGSFFDAEIGGLAPGAAINGYDRLIVTGGVTLNNPNLNLALVNSFMPTVGDIFYLITNDGVDAVTGTFFGLANDSLFAADGWMWRIRYNVRSESINSFALGSGNDIAIQAEFMYVPEPSALLLTAWGLAAGGVALRRRMKRNATSGC